jgi:hypothetical protein
MTPAAILQARGTPASMLRGLDIVVVRRYACVCASISMNGISVTVRKS